MTFLDQNFLLQTKSAERLYHDFAENQPIIDYHNHLPPHQIDEDYQFKNLTEIWLKGDHYKWRAMRANGISEHFITGDATDEEKFVKWAETVPNSIRNPLFHWTHLELQRYFGIKEVLTVNNAKKIYTEASEKVNSSEYSCRSLLKKFKVEALCTTDDPTDSLQHHQNITKSDFSIKVLPTFRPDKAMNVDNESEFLEYVRKIQVASNVTVTDFNSYLAAIQNRHDFFAATGGKLSDHGLNHIYATDYTEVEVSNIFSDLLAGKNISEHQKNQFKSAMLVYLAHMDHAKGWVQQFHLGALRNNNSRLLTSLGPDTGFDSMGDFSQAENLSKFLNKLDSTNQLAKTILYNNNPVDNASFATMIGNFQDGTVAGKMQFGSGWWFLDQKLGMEEQINNLSNMGLLSRFVGMLTDSRSFMSFPRHEYFRRILCNMIGNDIENGELPDDIEWLGGIVGNICYGNANEYFGF
ncbi:MAG: glucuronate isomerase [Bacteroidota bacterium]